MNQAEEPPPISGKSRRRWRFWIIGISLGVVVFSVLLATQLFLPMPGSHATNNLVKCANNLRQIGLAIQLYANDNDEHYPDSFASLYAHGDVASSIFNCPETSDTPAEGPTTQAIEADLSSGGHLSYTYLGRGLTIATATANTIVAYEPISNHKDGINILFGDGHVEYFVEPQADRILARIATGELPVTMPSNP